MEKEWEDEIRRMRVKMNNLYGLLMSYLEINIDPKIERPCLSFDGNTGNYKLVFPDMERMKKIAQNEEEMDFVMVHELEHLLRLHIPRGYDLVANSKMKRILGFEYTDAVVNVIEDFLINTSIKSMGGVLKNVVTKVESIKILAPWAEDSIDGIDDIKSRSVEEIFRVVDSLEIPKEDSERIKSNPSDFEKMNFDDVDIISYASVRNNLNGGYDPTSIGVIQDSELLMDQSKAAGNSSLKDYVMLNSINTESYDVRSFLSSIVTFIQTDEVVYTKRRPPRKPNTEYGIVRVSLTPKAALLVDSSGSVPHDEYMEMFKIAKTVFSHKGADLITIVFDGGVVKVHKGVPDKLEKTDGGTLFMPPLLRAIDEGYTNIVMMTDGYNFDIISKDVFEKAMIIFLITPGGNYTKTKSEIPIPKGSVYNIDMSSNRVTPVK